MKLCRLVVVVLLIAVIAGCTSYTDKNKPFRDAYYAGRYDESITVADGLLEKAGKHDLHLYFLERGKVKLACGDYDGAIKDLQVAEERFGTIEGTISPADFLKGMITSPTRQEYQPPDHEKILINSYLLLAYWMKGDREGAFVERNRIINNLKSYLGKYPDEELKQFDVPFARYLTSILYEMEGLDDDARIEYGAIRRVSPGAAPDAVNMRTDEIVLFVEIGMAPLKISQEIKGYLKKHKNMLIGGFMLPGRKEPFIFSIPVGEDFELQDSGKLFAFAYPKYVKQTKAACSARMVVDGMECGTAIPLDNIEGTAIAAFKKELGWILLKSAFRTYLKLRLQGDAGKKGGVGGALVDGLFKGLAAAEKADTRSWQTLPSEVHVFRMECEPGSHEVFVRYFGKDGNLLGESRKVTVTVEKGRKGIVYLPGRA